MGKKFNYQNTENMRGPCGCHLQLSPGTRETSILKSYHVGHGVRHNISCHDIAIFCAFFRFVMCMWVMSYCMCVVIPLCMQHGTYLIHPCPVCLSYSHFSNFSN